MGNSNFLEPVKLVTGIYSPQKLVHSHMETEKNWVIAILRLQNWETVIWRPNKFGYSYLETEIFVTFFVLPNKSGSLLFGVPKNWVTAL